MGDPQFFAQAIGLEIVFVTLMILSIKKIRLSLIPNIIIGIVVMVGNSISSQHIEIMSSLTPLGNALILFIGGYVLQLLLISSSIVCLKNR